MEFKSFIARSFTKEQYINRVSHLPKQDETWLCNLVKTPTTSEYTQTICGCTKLYTYIHCLDNRTCFANPALTNLYSNFCTYLLAFSGCHTGPKSNTTFKPHSFSNPCIGFFKKRVFGRPFLQHWMFDNQFKRVKISSTTLPSLVFNAQLGINELEAANPVFWKDLRTDSNIPFIIMLYHIQNRTR
jgi:hypothetical protein